MSTLRIGLPSKGRLAEQAEDLLRQAGLSFRRQPRSRLSEAERPTPGFNSPTASSLEDPAWCAVRVMVRRSEVIQVMEQLEEVGASAILETPISNCRL